MAGLNAAITNERLGMPDALLLREHARQIWEAGVDAVRSERLIADSLRREGDQIEIRGERLALSELNRIAVVGAGKAGAGMGAAVESALGSDIVEQKVDGWINVPADCVRPLSRIHLHPGRPAGVNEPTEEGAEGALRILQLVNSLNEDDLCLVLLSGGGSALLPAPRPPLTLADKRAVTQYLMNAGATIQELNTVRKRLSLVKGGGLAKASNAGRLIALIISDIIDDPLDMIASGPTFPDYTTSAEASEILQKFGAQPPDVPQAVFDCLNADDDLSAPPRFPRNVTNHIIGNNQTALEAAAARAEEFGYEVISLGSANAGEANAEGRSLAEQCRSIRDDPQRAGGRWCVLSGGEPVVHLSRTDQPRRGGRNQQLVLAGVEALQSDGMDRIVLLSGGTDGEDGPTDAAGAFGDGLILESADQHQLDLSAYRQACDAYTFFEQTGGLLKTGPTHTNVMDLRVALVEC